jgi:enterobacteria phage integrase
MARPRNSRGTRQLPEGLYARAKLRGGREITYYAYRSPLTGREVSLGTDLRAALRAVRIVSLRQAPDPVLDLLRRIERPAATWGEHVTWFRQVHLAGRRSRTGVPLSAATMAMYGTSLAKAAVWDLRPVDTISRAECVALIEAQPGRSGQVLRGHLMQLFATAVARGLRADNPVEGTLRPQAVIQRARLTQAGYDAVYAAAPDWLRRAMRLSLLSLQRPGDLCALPRASWDGAQWQVRQAKSASAGYGLLRIRPHAELAAALDDCAAHAVAGCDRLLCYQPQRRRPAAGRAHWAELSDQILSRQFAALRDACPHPDLRPQGLRPPSYYEIKALGARRYQEAGRPVEWIQALAGHQDAATTRIYTGRHEDAWVVVDLG